MNESFHKNLNFKARSHGGKETLPLKEMQVEILILTFNSRYECQFID